MPIVPISEAASNVERGQSKDIFVPGGSQLYDQGLSLYTKSSCWSQEMVLFWQWYSASRERCPTLSRSVLSELIIPGAPAEMVVVEVRSTHHWHYHHHQLLASVHCVKSFSVKLAGLAPFLCHSPVISLSKLHKVPSPHIISSLIIPPLMCSKVNEDEGRDGEMELCRHLNIFG